MKPIEQLEMLAKSARDRQKTFLADVRRFSEKAAEAEKEAEDFEKAAMILRKENADAELVAKAV